MHSSGAFVHRSAPCYFLIRIHESISYGVFGYVAGSQVGYRMLHAYTPAKEEIWGWLWLMASEGEVKFMRSPDVLLS